MGSIEEEARPLIEEGLILQEAKLLAYYGIAGNLITYLTTKLHQRNVFAVTNVITWFPDAIPTMKPMMTSLPNAFIATNTKVLLEWLQI
ncbi:unnamed protein product [Arabidopsis lyrata]|nr:unnamed protein product [Arabidopsis lyrata]